MLRNALAALVLLMVVAAAPASAQEWVQKMFKTTTHDFGTVARGSKAEFRFPVKNVFEEDARIVSVTSSCHCIAPQITRRELKSQETSEIVAELNTRDFQGPRTVTLTVTVECVSRATIELRLTGNIRSDVVTQPGAIDFGSVPFGTAAEQSAASQVRRAR